ncbi:MULTISPECIES: dihydrofolate reductase [unclassified Oleiphilus]|jgi:dihydrofolate reductase|uniref:dihydrofolate reductase n=5 Tax=Oleiphilus TaxID=141450 RepID=UPI0007C39080|nr:MULTISPECIES: dihydrofolate reductase [unclassified Oleiphilus]KZY49971.1 dihydrofolate reductase [Oleiphilus sp. HI0050]KZY75600.1 dihydrofolate reductase [Oleiphilus sp. HI0069]KZY83196.1 dihydrofolate reductase [Oleiphilus sp. HI0068]KZY87344.1 dihydrofolate reductase [Oleiphilus sp. HI0072]KZZ19830.1 dihydrofolate reductase [Oleiphilus sp. HI0081]KZZ19938.1 dihydrofolate reductase [Oleiphilus sp. HI0078]KZZ31148.1 dihydrofolate reductase [Oleiphilus sp. HI0085]
MKRSMIVAMAENRVIGINNKLPWYLPNDLKYFKQVTMGKPILMGRKTYESIGKPLPGRCNIVITRNESWSAEGVKVVHSLEQAFDLGESVCDIDGQSEVMIIGGDQIYQTSLPDVDRIYLTKVHAEVEGDAYFPEVDWTQWREIGREDFEAEGPNPYDYSFIVLDRK